MTDAEKAAIERACTRLVLEYARFNDDLAFDRVLDLFVEDCVFVRPSDADNPCRGKARLRAMYEGRKPRLARHIMSNILITAVSADEALGHSYVTMMSAPDPEQPWPRPAKGIFIGAFDDVFVKTLAGWKFKSRKGSMALHQVS